MFIISQYLLSKSNLCTPNNVSTYSIAIGLVIYSSIYLYLLYYGDELLYTFNKFIVFIIGIDLLLSAFYHFNNGQQQQDTITNKIEDFNFENEDDTNKIQEHLNISDDELTEDFDEDLDPHNLENNLSENPNEHFEEETIEEEPNEPLQQEPNEPLQQEINEPLQQELLQQLTNEPLQQEVSVDNKIVELSDYLEEPKPKPKRQSKKRNTKVEQVV